MKGLPMQLDWRTVKFFLDEEFGVSEVSVCDSDSRKIKCTCPRFIKSAKCRHVSWVRTWMDEHDGVISIKIPESVDPDEHMEYFNDLERFREFVVKYGKVEYL